MIAGRATEFHQNFKRKTNNIKSAKLDKDIMLIELVVDEAKFQMRLFVVSIQTLQQLSWLKKHKQLKEKSNQIQTSNFETSH